MGQELYFMFTKHKNLKDTSIFTNYMLINSYPNISNIDINAANLMYLTLFITSY